MLKNFFHGVVVVTVGASLYHSVRYQKFIKGCQQWQFQVNDVFQNYFYFD